MQYLEAPDLFHRFAAEGPISVTVSGTSHTVAPDLSTQVTPKDKIVDKDGNHLEISISEHTRDLVSLQAYVVNKKGKVVTMEPFVLHPGEQYPPATGPTEQYPAIGGFTVYHNRF